jgi:hypothetical protein
MSGSFGFFCGPAGAGHETTLIPWRAQVFFRARRGENLPGVTIALLRPVGALRGWQTPNRR